MARRIKPSLDMTRQELNNLTDHDLLLLLHERVAAHDERLKAHSEEHKQATITFRWTVGVVLTILIVIASAAAVIGRGP